MNHYTLPAGNVQIAFSGGRTSAYLLHQILEANGGLPDRAVVAFQNTGREMPETLDFVQECGSRWGVPITWLEYAPRREITSAELELVERTMGETMVRRLKAWWQASDSGFRIVSNNSAAIHGEPLLALILHRKFLPNQAARFCTIETKVRTAKRYLRSIDWDYWTNAVGLRADEPSRLKEEGVKHGDRWMIWQPLARAGITKRHVAEFWLAQPFDLRLPNINGKCPWGNCDGCFLKSEATISALCRDFPERHDWWEGLERLVAALWPMLTKWQRLRRIVTAEPDLPPKLREAYGRPIPHSVVESMVNQPRSAGQWSKRYSRSEIRNFLERQGDAFRPLDDPRLCQASDGECFA